MGRQRGRGCELLSAMRIADAPDGRTWPAPCGDSIQRAPEHSGLRPAATLWAARRVIACSSHGSAEPSRRCGSPIREADSAPTTHPHSLNGSKSASSVASRTYRAVIINWSPVCRSMASSYAASASSDSAATRSPTRDPGPTPRFIPHGLRHEEDDCSGVCRNGHGSLVEPLQLRRNLATPKWTPRRGEASVSAYGERNAENTSSYSNRGICRIYCDGPGRRDVARVGAAATFEVVASGLDSPRHLTFSGSGDLYVAEAGQVGVRWSCAVHPELGEFCLGFTGAVTKVRDHGPDPES